MLDGQYGFDLGEAMTRIFWIFSVFFALFVAFFIWLGRSETSGPAGFEQTTGPGQFAVVDVTLFDGEQFQDGQTVLVDGGLIKAVGAGLQISPTVRKISGSGMTLLPGLIDAHTHTFGTALADALNFGIASQLDMFTLPAALPEARANRENRAQFRQADLYSAGMLATVAGGHGTQYGVPVETLSGPGDAPSWVDARIKEGSDYIKLVYMPDDPYFASLDRETARALIKAGHRAGLKVVAHISTHAGAMDMVSDGIDGLVHVFADQPVSDAFMTLALERGIFVVPTLAVLSSVSARADATELARNSDVAPYLSPAQKSTLPTVFPERLPGYSYEMGLENTRKLFNAGIPILAGSDAPNPGTAHGISLHHEMELLVDAGLSRREALQAATSIPASFFGLSGRGRIVAGARADLVLVNGQIDRDTQAVTTDIAAIWKNGVRVQRQEFSGADAVDTAVLGAFDEGLDAPQGLMWTVSDDRFMGGASVSSIALAEDEDPANGGILAVSGEVKYGFAYPWAGAALVAADGSGGVFSLEPYRRMKFRVRGTPGSYRVMFIAPNSVGAPPAFNFQMTEEWQEVTVDFDIMRRLDISNLSVISFVAGPAPTAFEFSLDSVILEGP